MNKKNKFLIFFLVIIAIITVIKFCDKNYLIYTIKSDKKKFTIKEKYNSNGYYIEITTSKNIYPFILKVANGKRIVQSIVHYSDDKYECILPILKSNLRTELMCIRNNILYDYTSIKGNDADLDNYVKSLAQYDFKNFYDDLSKKVIRSDTTFYTSNNIDYNVYITSYKGLSNPSKEIDIFKNDVYKNTLSAFINNYYIVADYENSYEFKYIYVINLENHKIFKLKSKKSISYDSYIQGIVNNKAYLYDKNNEVQYEIDIESKTIKEISTQDAIQYYKNDKWQTINKALANKELYFDNDVNSEQILKYDKSVKVDNLYYLFKLTDSGYDLYKMYEENTSIIKYIANVPTLDVTFKDDYIYYVSGDKLYFYSDLYGLRTILKNNELKFNKTIKYYVY